MLIIKERYIKGVVLIKVINIFGLVVALSFHRLLPGSY